MSGLQGGVGEDLSSGDHGEEESGERLGDFDADPAVVFALSAPGVGACVIGVITGDEIAGGLHEDGAESSVGAFDEGSGGIDAVALIAGGDESGATGDAFGIGVVGDGSQFAGEVGDGDDVDSGEGEKEGVGSLHDELGEIDFDGVDGPGFFATIVVEGGEDALLDIIKWMSLGSVSGPIEDFGDGVLAWGDALVFECGAESVGAGEEDVGGGVETSGDGESGGALPEVGEGGLEAGHGGVEGFADLVV